MSGGSYNYAYRNVEQICIRPTTPERRAFQRLLDDVAKALHDIEWVDSDDYGPGDETAAIRKCLTGERMMAQLISEAKAARDALVTEIEAIEGKP